jgi:D-arabinose 1-dehydrogenase-like Zn-dependent alcohol dehydrogenase
MIRTGFKQGARVFLKDIEQPPLEPDDIRVGIDACGICGTDMHVTKGEANEAPFGHEIAGTILEIGCRVTGLAVGQRVVLESSSACGRCSNCRNTRQELCSDIQSFWSSPNRGFAEEMVSPAICAIPTPHSSARTSDSKHSTRTPSTNWKTLTRGHAAASLAVSCSNKACA